AISSPDGALRLDRKFLRPPLKMPPPATLVMAREAQARLDRLDDLKRRDPRVVSAEEYSAAVPTRDRPSLKASACEGRGYLRAGTAGSSPYINLLDSSLVTGKSTELRSREGEVLLGALRAREEEITKAQMETTGPRVQTENSLRTVRRAE